MNSSVNPEDFVAPPRDPDQLFHPRELAEEFKLEMVGPKLETGILANPPIKRVERPQDIAEPGSLTWLKSWDSPLLDVLVDRPMGTVVAPQVVSDSDTQAVERLQQQHVVLIAAKPRLTFAALVDLCFPHLQLSTYVRLQDRGNEPKIPNVQRGPRIDSSARVDPTAIISQGVEVCSGVYIGPGAHIGRNSWIQPNAVIHEGTIIGHRCIVGANTVIGGRGFGFVRDDAGELVHMPHVGAVFIGNDVEIGSNTSIDRAVMEYTRIGDGTKIDNLVHIAHGVNIGRHCVIVACAELGAGVVVEDFAWVGPNACTLENVRIGQRAVVGAGAVVTRSVGEEETVAGSPAERTDILSLRRAVVKRLIDDVADEESPRKRYVYDDLVRERGD